MYKLATHSYVLACIYVLKLSCMLMYMYLGGVHWLTVGQMTNSRGELDSGKLLSKLQTVILRLDKNKTYRPPNIEAATDYLQQVGFLYYSSVLMYALCPNHP